MAHALQLAARGLGRVWPNPAVGCVLVRDGRVVGRGWTQPGGRPHAEAGALAQAGDLARGATAYVTLEPCAHHGKTPPCAAALRAAGVARVVTALTDPDPRVAGRGHAMLRAAGIEVREGVMQAEARALTKGFLKRVTRGLPMVTLKLATSLDGQIATRTQDSRWITGPEARRAVHAMRMQYDAVMVGSGTALADDPDLTIRDVGATHQPIRLLVDSHLRLSPHSRLGQTAQVVPVWMLHGPGATDAARAAWQATGATLIPTASANGHLDLSTALMVLADRGLTRVLCEGGAGLAAALIAAGLVDDVVTFGAGVMIGGDGVGCLGPLGVSRLADAPRLRLLGAVPLGGDVMVHWTFD